MPVEFNEQADIDEHLPGDGHVGVIEFAAEYALYVNFETKYADSNIPFEPIFEYVQRNWSDLSTGLTEAALYGGSDQTGAPRYERGSEAHMRATAWAMIEVIKEHGIEGVHFAERAQQHGIDQVEEIAQRYHDEPEALRKIAEDVIEAMYERAIEIIEDEAHDTGHLLESGSYELTSGYGG